jgi:hypothetical protein
VQYQAFGITIQFLQSEVKNTSVKPPNREIPNLMINMFSVSVLLLKTQLLVDIISSIPSDQTVES